MNESSMGLHSLFVVLFALLLGACTPASSSEPPLKGARLGGSFSLVDQNGRQVSDSDYNGRYRLIYFGYSYCPDVCPVDLQVIGQGLRQFERSDKAGAARVQPIFITTDPERDTPAVLKDYVAAFHPRLIGLTGTPEQIAKVSKSFGIWSQKRDNGGASDYLVDHSRIAMLFGPEGEPIAIVPHDKGPEAVAEELERWVT
jgi:protein SCO1